MRDQAALHLRGGTRGMRPHTGQKPLVAGTVKRRIHLNVALKYPRKETAYVRRAHFRAVKWSKTYRMNILLDFSALGPINRAHNHAVSPEVEERRIGKIRGERFDDLSPQELQLALVYIADPNCHCYHLITN